MSVIAGKDAILYWKVDGVFAPICCMESCNLTTNVELSETSTIQSGTSRTYRGKRNTWTVSCRGLVSFDTNHPHVKLRQLQQLFTVIPISFSATDPNGISSTFSGNVIITSMPDDAAANDFYTYGIEATGTGPYVITDIPVDSNECCQDAWIYYTGTGSEGNVVTIDNLIGRTIAGRLYRDGIEYRPSGLTQDGTGAPLGKQFKFEPAVGRVTFDPSLTGIASGEPIDIPWNLCGSLTSCQIEIKNVDPSPNAGDGNKFYITFVPEIGNVITPPDDVRVRYSTNNGATWITPASITYDPNTNYGLVIINDALPIDVPYLFEITPICNDSLGISGTGYWFTCQPVQLFNTTLPNATIDVPYNQSIQFVGTLPVTITDIVKPSWMTISIVGNFVNFTGTPTATALDQTVSFTLHNCTDDIDTFSQTIDVNYGHNLICVRHENEIVGVEIWVWASAFTPVGTNVVVDFNLLTQYESIHLTRTITTGNTESTHSKVDYNINPGDEAYTGVVINSITPATDIDGTIFDDGGDCT